jgi:NADPH:quinone reductase-like Zn-dependent oxidoreductase
LPIIKWFLVRSLHGNAFGNGAVLGCDFTGTVEKLGEKVATVKVGHQIAGLIWGATRHPPLPHQIFDLLIILFLGEIPGLGDYSQYTIADLKILFKVPDYISSADAATVSLAAGTAQLALYSEPCLNISRKQKNATPVLVWGEVVSESSPYFAIT